MTSLLFWVLVFSYWIHLMATVVWFGSLMLLTLTAWPALRRGTLAANEWLALQRKSALPANISLLLLLITGFVQMTNDPNYHGFLAVDSLWAWAILVKHIAFVGVVGVTAYWQVSLYPAMDRARLLAEKRPNLGAAEQADLARREGRLLRLNLFWAIVILFCTAAATAV